MVTRGGSTVKVQYHWRCLSMTRWCKGVRVWKRPSPAPARATRRYRKHTKRLLRPAHASVIGREGCKGARVCASPVLVRVLRTRSWGCSPACRRPQQRTTRRQHQSQSAAASPRAPRRRQRCSPASGSVNLRRGARGARTQAQALGSVNLRREEQTRAQALHAASASECWARA